MPALFSKAANSIYWLAIAAIGGGVVGVPAFLIGWARTPYATGQGEPAEQPVKFDHRHHVRDDGIDCLYCHSTATKTASAGMPATALCMGCHNQVWTQSPEVAPVRTSFFEDRPIHWNRVNTLPDFVFFDHAAHTTHGIGCVDCHGRVDQMGQVFAAQPLTMRFCLDCHRDPQKHVRPLDRITDMDWKDDGNSPRVPVRSLTDCTHCHR